MLKERSQIVMGSRMKFRVKKCTKENQILHCKGNKNNKTIAKVKGFRVLFLCVNVF